MRSETLYGVTRDQGRREAMFELLIELPYSGASIQNVAYEDAAGLVVLIGEGSKDSAAGHSLHATWKLDLNDGVLSRATKELEGAGRVTLDLAAPPYFLSIGLVDANGFLVDNTDAYATNVQPDHSPPLPPQALPEALDHLDSAWRNAFAEWLFVHAQMTEISGLALPVSSRADFESRVSYLADILKSARIPDALLDPKSAEELRRDASLGRLRVVLEAHLPPDAADEAIAAVVVLANASRLRVALQHAGAEDLPDAMARLGLESPGDWGQNWERLRYRAVSALTHLRLSITSLVDAKAMEG
jgi:hypothetical protein